MRRVSLRFCGSSIGAARAFIQALIPCAAVSGRADALHVQRLLPCQVLLASFLLFLAIKLSHSFHLVLALRGERLLQMVAVVSSLCLCVPSLVRLGAVGWAGILGRFVVEKWPYTINHVILELECLLAIAALGSSAMFSPSGEDACRRLIRVLWFSIVIVWFFSGVQKVAHGQFLNGKCLAIAFAFDDGALGTGLRAVVGGFHGLLRSTNSASFPIEPGSMPALGDIERYILLSLSWTTIAVELALPVLAAVSARRMLATTLLVAAQVVVGLISGEIDFLWMGLGLLNLGFVQGARVRYLTLIALMLVVGALRMLW